jgi:glycosyltransferase involved in cell wall biosynthesis
MLDEIGECEQRAIDNATCCVFSSDWASESAVRDYGKDPSRVRTIPFGPNLEGIPARDEIPERPRDTCRLLFVGRDWERKGGDIAVETTRLLNEAGVPATLIIVGATPRVDLPYVQVVGMLDRNNPAHLWRYNELLASSHFMFVPSRAEAFGMIFCEAASFGLPIISTETGGISTVVHNGVSGFLLSASCSSSDYADLINRSWASPELYQTLLCNARSEYERRLNWSAWSRSVCDLLISYT